MGVNPLFVRKGSSNYAGLFPACQGARNLGGPAGFDATHHLPVNKILPLAGALAVSICANAAAQDGVLDLTELENYANQTIPAYINRNNTPAGNAITDRGATLGRVLFYDKRLSRNDTISCASCHQQAHAFSDGAAASTGRHSMRLINSRFSQEPRFFWDERATSLENQSAQPIKDHVEMGFSGTSGDPAFSDLVTKLSAIADYRVLFAMTFGDATITEDRIQRAISQFVRSIQSFDSKYDAGRATTPDNQPFANFTAAENAGKQLFLTPVPNGGAGCAGCHRPPEFDIDPNSLNNGVTTPSPAAPTSSAPAPRPCAISSAPTAKPTAASCTPARSQASARSSTTTTSSPATTPTSTRDSDAPAVRCKT